MEKKAIVTILLSILLTGFPLSAATIYYLEEPTKTPHGVSYRAGFPTGYSKDKKYFICLTFSGQADRIEWRLVSVGNLFGYGEEAGFYPIYISADYCGDYYNGLPPANNALYQRFEEFLTDLLVIFPNAYPVIVGAGFCYGGYFFTAYNSYRPQDKRLRAVAVESAMDIVIPTASDGNFLRILFTAGSRDGILNKVKDACSKFQNLGYNSSFYMEQGAGHEIETEGRRTVARFLKTASDSLLKTLNLNTAVIDCKQMRTRTAVSDGDEKFMMFSLNGTALDAVPNGSRNMRPAGFRIVRNASIRPTQIIIR